MGQVEQNIPFIEYKYPITSNCLELITKEVTPDKKQAVVVNFTYNVLNEYMPVVFYLSTLRHGVLVCLDMDIEEVRTRFSEFNNDVVDLSKEFNEVVGLARLNNAIMGSDWQTARRVLDDVVENMKNLGLPGHATAFRALNENALNEMKRGRVTRASEYASKAAGVITMAEYEYIIRGLSRKYSVLWFSNYAIVLLKPPMTGLHNMPTDYVSLMKELARLFPSDVVVHEDPNDEDAAFVYAMSKVSSNKNYVLILLDAYLRLHGLSLDGLSQGSRVIAIKFPFFVPWILKGLRNGYLTYIDVIGNTTYLIEFPKNRQNNTGDFKALYENALKLRIGLAPTEP